MTLLLAILAVILTLIITIGLHEMGHAVVAHYFQVGIKRISLGFGKILFRWRSAKGIEWCWSLVPLGGYVYLLNSRIEPVEPAELPFCMDKKPVWIRCLILVAGGFMNIVVSVIALTLLFKIGYTQVLPIVPTIVPGSMAAQAGFMKEDKLLKINDYEIQSWQDASMYFLMALGEKNVPVVIMRKNEKKMLHLNLNHLDSRTANYLTAIGFSLENYKSTSEKVEARPWFSSFIESVQKCQQLLVFYLVSVKQLLVGNISFSLLLGPLSFLSVSIESFLHGLTAFLYFIASLSLVIALVNWLPIPGLDGGSIMYALLEKIRGKPISVSLEVLIHRLVTIFFVLLLVQLLLNDLQKMVERRYSKPVHNIERPHV